MSICFGLSYYHSTFQTLYNDMSVQYEIEEDSRRPVTTRKPIQATHIIFHGWKGTAHARHPKSKRSTTRISDQLLRQFNNRHRCKDSMRKYEKQREGHFKSRPRFGKMNFEARNTKLLQLEAFAYYYCSCYYLSNLKIAHHISLCPLVRAPRHRAHQGWNFIRLYPWVSQDHYLPFSVRVTSSSE